MKADEILCVCLYVVYQYLCKIRYEMTGEGGGCFQRRILEDFEWENNSKFMEDAEGASREDSGKVQVRIQ